MGVALLVIIDVAILTTYTTVEGINGQLSSNRIPNRENSEDVMGVSHQIIQCMFYVPRINQMHL